ncbi:helix-turn-helix domain-containing protein [Lentisphaerota bacterium WC36G]|nr:helix-turn-helix domain-containing protein [Lentisphaerae bacterium WC36]
MRKTSIHTKSILNIIEAIPDYSLDTFIAESCGNLPNNLVSTKEACEILKCRRQTLHNYVKKKLIKKYSANGGKTPKYNRYELKKLANAR